MDLTFRTEQGKLNIRVAAVIIKNGKILLEKDEQHGFYGFIGGRVMFGETAEHAIERELTEELGEKPRIIRPLYVAQNLFAMDSCRYHEIGFYFLAEVSQSLYDRGTFKNLDGKNIFCWLDLYELSSVKIVPEYIKNRLNDLPDGVEIITAD